MMGLNACAGAFWRDWRLHTTLQHGGPVRVEPGATGGCCFCGGKMFG